jgi:hypothetical protein
MSEYNVCRYIFYDVIESAITYLEQLSIVTYLSTLSKGKRERRG